jgi:Amt family ammonium transporter
MLVGVFAQKALNPGGADGLLAGNAALLGKQALGLLAAGIHAGVFTLAILFVVNKTVGLRVPEEEEREGLDAAQHGEAGYTT